VKSAQEISNSVIDEMRFLVLYPETWKDLKRIVLKAVREMEQGAFEDAACIVDKNGEGDEFFVRNGVDREHRSASQLAVDSNRDAAEMIRKKAQERLEA